MVTRWAKRLLDLRTTILNAEKNYFDPDLFRLNINHAITTSRTVTFLMQKEKNERPGLAEWYVENVQDPLKADNLMGWLVDSRNIIEKQGDLDVHSSWRARHLYSYYGDGDVIESSSSENLFASVGKLVDRLSTHIPPGIIEDSAIVIERTWVANSRPDIELIDAVCYGYETLRKHVLAMDSFVDEASPDELLDSSPILSISQTRRLIIKLSDGETYSVANNETGIASTAETRTKFESLRATIGKLPFSSDGTQKSLADVVRDLSEYAWALFSDAGHHISLVLLISNRKPLDILSFEPADHIEKILFWHELAYSLRLREVDEVLFVSEAWLRRAESHMMPTSQWAIMGEILHVFGARKSGECYNIRREIVRDGENVRLSEESTESDAVPNFIIPLMRVWGKGDEWVSERIAQSSSNDFIA